MVLAYTGLTEAQMAKDPRYRKKTETEKANSPINAVTINMRGLSQAGIDARLAEEAAIQRIVQRARDEGTYRGADWDGDSRPIWERNADKGP